MNRHKLLKALICVLLGVLLITACSNSPQLTALPTSVPTTAIPPTATFTAIPPTTTPPPTATLEPTATSVPPQDLFQTITLAASPTPDFVIIASALEPIIFGQGVPEAAAYDPNKDGPHPVVLFIDSKSEYYDWNADIIASTDWFPKSVQETELVIIGKQSEIEAGKQFYCLQYPNTSENSTSCVGGFVHVLTSYQINLDVEVRAAQTGELLASYQVMGPEPGNFPRETTVDQTRIEGMGVPFYEFLASICPYVMPGQCWKIEQTEGRFTFVNGHNRVDFSPNGKTLAVGREDGTVDIRLVSDEMGSFRRLAGDSYRINSLAFSPDGETLATGAANGLVRIWNFSDEILLRTIVGSTDSINSLVFSPDGQILASVTDNGSVNLWQVSDGSLIRVLEGGADPINSIAFSPDGQILASGSTGTSVFLWKVADGTLWGTLESFTTGVTSLRFSPDGQTIAIAAGTFVEIRLVSDGSLIRKLDHGYYQPNSVAFSADNLLLASASGYLGSGTVFIWQLRDGRHLPSFNFEHACDMDSLAFSPDSETIASTDVCGTLFIWGK